jgi:hypothetical protein
MKDRRGTRRLYFALLPLYLLAAVVLLEALVIGSFSIQTVAASILFLGGLVLGGMAAAAVVAAKRGRAVRRWLLGYAAILAATLTLAVVSWIVTDALRSA